MDNNVGILSYQSLRDEQEILRVFTIKMAEQEILYNCVKNVLNKLIEEDFLI